jgi:predicted RNA-binding Zn-ribbon protein involved in translation (DUF1610 family)
MQVESSNQRFDEKKMPLAYECPECGAKVDKRCRMIGKSTFQSRAPHQERVSLAWRDWLTEHGGGMAC